MIGTLNAKAEDEKRLVAAHGIAIVSHTGELACYTVEKTGAADTDRTQAVIGFVQAHQKALKNLSADLCNSFASVVLASLDALGDPVTTWYAIEVNRS
ncbi:hypothetical protein SBA3_1740013 [Candidatus Sulfopaludibacter sp. SbA3]|nr:hypothetical protein SBA3_1740013 [Candidatus Sulfopaludibacter sp. SbA3]